MKRDVVITGLGCVLPIGQGAETAWNALTEGGQGIHAKAVAAGMAWLPPATGEILGFQPERHFSKKILRQTDRHTHFALEAAQQALADGGVDLETIDRARFGVVLGNNLGGSCFGEKQLAVCHGGRARSVSAFQSIAWFYAASIGQISIHYGLRGYSKTYVADRASAHVAMGDAFRAIQRGDLDGCLTGGAEAPLSPYALLGYREMGLLSEDGSFRAFQQGAAGAVIGEGSAVILMEEKQHAVQRGARIYAQMLGFGQSCDAVPSFWGEPSGTQYARAMGLALEEAMASPGSVAAVFPDGCGRPEADRRESQALARTFGARRQPLRLGLPKTSFGHLVGAAGAADLLLAVLAMKHGVMPPLYATMDFNARGASLAFSQGPEPLGGGVMMVLGTGMGGQNAALVLKSTGRFGYE